MECERVRLWCERVNFCSGPLGAGDTHTWARGGLVLAVMLATGAPGVTFNAAGLSDNTLRSLDLGKTPNAIREELAGSGQIRRYNEEGELLTGLQQGAMLAPTPWGMSCVLPRPEAFAATPWNCMAARATARLMWKPCVKTRPTVPQTSRYRFPPLSIAWKPTGHRTQRRCHGGSRQRAQAIRLLIEIGRASCRERV